MDFITLLVMAIALSMDAFAVSVARAMATRSGSNKDCIVSAASFGIAQGVMPIVGFYASGLMAGELIHSGGKLITAVVLTFLGIKMLWDCRETCSIEGNCTENYWGTLLAQAIATSIDAMAVGVGIYASGQAISLSSAVIGVITFLVCLLGYSLGSSLGANGSRLARGLAGGILLVLAVKAYIG